MRLLWYPASDPVSKKDMPQNSLCRFLRAVNTMPNIQSWLKLLRCVYWLRRVLCICKSKWRWCALNPHRKYYSSVHVDEAAMPMPQSLEHVFHGWLGSSGFARAVLESSGELADVEGGETTSSLWADRRLLVVSDCVAYRAYIVLTQRHSLT